MMTMVRVFCIKVSGLQVVVVPIPGHPIKLLESQTYTFDLLSRSPYSMLYSFYKAFVWFGYALMLVNLLRRKYAVIFGGASDNAD